MLPRRDGRRQEHHCVAIGQARHRRARTLGRFDQTDDAGIGTLGRPPRRQEMEGLTDVGRAAHDAIADLLLDRHGFAGQGRLVENGQAFYDRSVDRHHIAFSNHEAIARLDHVQVDLLEPAPMHTIVW
jgi:hypothetical protein